MGGYDESIKIEDWFIFLKLTNQNKILRYIPEILCQYRIHEENFSKNSMNMIIEMKKVANCFKTMQIIIKLIINLIVAWLKSFIDKV